MFIANEAKTKSLTLVASIFGLALVSSFSIYDLPIYNQSFASLESNDRVLNSIKKVCPNYGGNNDIKDLVNDILKACFDRGDGNQPPINPSPDPINFPDNVLELNASVSTSAFDPIIREVNFTISDSNSNYVNSYNLLVFRENPNPSVSDSFIIPVGDQYTLNVSVKTDDPTPPGEDPPYSIYMDSQNCQQVSETTCVGTMSTSGEQLRVTVVKLGV